MTATGTDAAVVRWGLTSRRAALRTSQLRTDETLFSELYAQHSPVLDRYIRSILRDSCEAEDVLQNVMLKAFSALRTETRDFELRPWLFRIAHNEAISRTRAQRPTDELDESTLATNGSLCEPTEAAQSPRRAHARPAAHPPPSRPRPVAGRAGPRGGDARLGRRAPHRRLRAARHGP